jgi:hypothetical protein
MIRKSILIICCTLLFSIFAYGQKGIVRGYIFDAQSGQPISYGNIWMGDNEASTVSDYNGFYNLAGLREGNFTLHAAYLGYDTTHIDITVSNGNITTLPIYLTESGIALSEVKISARKFQSRTEVQVAKISISPQEIKSLPSVGGEADIAQYLQVLPGVVSTGDQGGQLYVRGGAPVQNKILLDGLNIYNPFHSLGFYSVFETELIRNVDVYTGGFNADYGGRTSAVIDIKTREGNKSRFSGFGSVSPFMTKLLLETPISKFEKGQGSTSIVVTGKKSLIDQTSKTFYKYAAVNDSIGLPFAFQDFYTKLSVVSSTGNKVNIFGFNFKDEYNNPSVAKIGWGNTGVGADFTMVPASSDIIVKGIIGYTNYDLGIKESTDKRSSAIKEFGAAVDFTLYGNKKEIRYGFDLKAVKTDFNFINPYRLLLKQAQNTTEFSVFAKYKQIIGNLIIEPSARLMYYASQSRFRPEPRLGMKYNLSNKLRLKAAGGFYSQNILSTSNERDVVNLFYGFVTSPESQVQGLNGQNIQNKLQLARHAIGGIEYNVKDNLLVSLETYLKDFNQLLVVNRNKVSTDQSDYAVEKGKAYGVDFSFKYDERKFTLYGTYSYGFVDRNDGKQTYYTVFDRRHNANMLATYTLDKKGDFQISARWNLGSGFPFSKTQGFYNQLNFVSGPNTDYLTENPNQIGIIYSQIRNGGRLPYYHRLDVSVTKKWKLSKHTYVETIASITNGYDRDNIFYFDRIKYSRVNQLPFMPALAMKVGF